jgi:hypothetical protein
MTHAEIVDILGRAEWALDRMDEKELSLRVFDIMISVDQRRAAEPQTLVTQVKDG